MQDYAPLETTSADSEKLMGWTDRQTGKGVVKMKQLKLPSAVAGGGGEGGRLESYVHVYNSLLDHM